jgi:hypothetical protein
MPRVQHPNPRDEHLVFVKNVPAYLATATIPELFAQYEPLRIKNVYPSGDITTVVVAFRRYEEAAQAQQKTDGMRLESVVLRVEMYSKHRSLRFLREGRATKRPFGAAQERLEDEAEEYPIHHPEEQYAPPLEQICRENSGRATWAQIVRHDRQPGMLSLPAPPTVANEQISTNGQDGASLTIGISVANLHLSHAPGLDDAHSNCSGTERTWIDSPQTTPTEITSNEDHLKDDRKMEALPVTPNGQLMAFNSIFAVSEPVGTDQRIRQRHCQHCTFCQLGMRLRS